MMKKLIALLIVVLAALCARAEIKFMDNPEWAKVLERAKAEKKLIFLDAYATWCGPCKLMDSETYVDKAVSDYYNANFINVKYDMEKGEGLALAGTYEVDAYPTFLFIDAEGKTVHKGKGFKASEQFITLGKEAIDPSLIVAEPEDEDLKKLNELKGKAPGLSPAAFLEFAALSYTYEDEDFPDIVTDYLLEQQDVLADTNLITLLVEYTNVLPDQQMLDHVIAGKSKFIGAGYAPEQVDQAIAKWVLSFAINSNFDDEANEVDLEGTKKILDTYLGEKAFFIYNIFSVNYHTDKQSPSNAFENLKAIVTAPSSQVSVEEAGNALMEYGPALNTGGYLEKLLAYYDAFDLPAGSGKDYYKDLVKTVVYHKLGEKEKFREFATKLVANTNTPEQIVGGVKQLLEKLQ